MGKYIYCITRGNSSKNHGAIGLGDEPSEVTALVHKDLSAIVSDSVAKKYELSRKNLITHQKVCERVMQESSILPVRFATVAESEQQIIQKILDAQYSQLSELLLEFSDKMELGLKVLWNDMAPVFQDILKTHPSLAKEKEELAKKDPEKSYYERADFGQKIQKALLRKKEQLTGLILSELEDLFCDQREQPCHGDKMILNLAFLVEHKHRQGFDDHISVLMDRFPNLYFKYVGPLPAYNFIEVVIDLEKGIFNSKKAATSKTVAAPESSKLSGG